MRIDSIKQQYAKNNQSFKGVNIFRDDYIGMMSIGVWITKAEENNAVKFINGRTGSYDLGTSKNAEKATEMLKKLGEKILEPKQIKKIRNLLKNIIQNDIIEELEKPRPFLNDKTFSVKDDILGEISLANISTAIKKGKPEYHSKGSTSPESCEVLSLKLDPNEEITIKTTRSNLSKIGIKQP